MSSSDRRRQNEQAQAGLHLDSVRSVMRVELARLAPDELLVLLLATGTKPEFIDALNAACADSAFHNRVLIIAHDADAFVVKTDSLEVRPTPQTIDLAGARVREFTRPR